MHHLAASPDRHDSRGRRQLEQEKPDAAADPGAHAVDDPGDVIAEDARHLQPGPAAIGPVTRIDRVDAGRMHGHSYLARPGRSRSGPPNSLTSTALIAGFPPVASQPRRIHPGLHLKPTS